MLERIVLQAAALPAMQKETAQKCQEKYIHARVEEEIDTRLYFQKETFSFLVEDIL